MKRTLFLLAILSVAGTASAEEICRSISTSWESGGQSYSTRMWTKAQGGCKVIVHEIEGETFEGVDCNCDLVMDGAEARISQPVSERQRQRLTDICLGPIADPKPETPDIYVLDSAD